MNFYCQVLNFPSHILSRVDSIFLLGTLNCKLLENDTIDKALDPLFHMLNETKKRLALRNIELEIVYFAGDTPICQGFCGMVVGVGSANSPCRKCNIHKNEITKIFKESDVILRTIDDYYQDPLKNGIKHVPDILQYSLIDPILQTPMDIMHVITEGILRRQIMNIFDAWEGRTDHREINKRIQSFNYQYLYKHSKIPSFIQSDLQKNQLIVSASQMKTLVLLFPFIFDGIVDINHDEYK